MDRKVTLGVPPIGVVEGGSQFGCRSVLCDVAHTVKGGEGRGREERRGEGKEEEKGGKGEE